MDTRVDSLMAGLSRKEDGRRRHPPIALKTPSTLAPTATSPPYRRTELRPLASRAERGVAIRSVDVRVGRPVMDDEAVARFARGSRRLDRSEHAVELQQ